ncbi:MAG: hypothetical protein JRI59_05155 [Deltaproteobacteria bacterium]|nr:hypothetical protein [Deltaproteobacteria bacterium]
MQIRPKGRMEAADVNPILGVAGSGLKVFPVVVIDLREVKGMAAEVPGLLEEGIKDLIAARKLALSREHPHLFWRIGQAGPLEDKCVCQGLCRNCPCRSAKDQKEAAVKPSPGRRR